MVGKTNAGVELVVWSSMNTGVVMAIACFNPSLPVMKRQQWEENVSSLCFVGVSVDDSQLGMAPHFESVALRFIGGNQTSSWNHASVDATNDQSFHEIANTLFGLPLG